MVDITEVEVRYILDQIMEPVERSSRWHDHFSPNRQF